MRAYEQASDVQGEIWWRGLRIVREREHNGSARALWWPLVTLISASREIGGVKQNRRPSPRISGSTLSSVLLLLSAAASTSSGLTWWCWWSLARSFDCTRFTRSVVAIQHDHKERIREWYGRLDSLCNKKRSYTLTPRAMNIIWVTKVRNVIYIDVRKVAVPMKRQQH